MGLKVNKEGGVTIGGVHYPLGTRKEIVRIEVVKAKEPSKSHPEGVPAVKGNVDEIDELLEKGYLVDAELEAETTRKNKEAKAAAKEKLKSDEKMSAKKGEGGK